MCRKILVSFIIKGLLMLILIKIKYDEFEMFEGVEFNHKPNPITSMMQKKRKKKKGELQGKFNKGNSMKTDNETLDD